METSKRLFRSRVYLVADRLGLEQTKVTKYVNTYFNLCHRDLLAGRVVQIHGFATLIPNVITNEFVKTTALYCKEVAAIENTTYYTVREIMRAFFDSCMEDLMDGQSVTFRTLVTLTPEIRQGNVVKIYSSLSATINNELQQQKSDVTSARSHLSKLLKSNLQRKIPVEVAAI